MGVTTRAGVIVATHGYQRRQRNRHGWSIGNRGGCGALVGLEGGQGRRRRSSGGERFGAGRRDRRGVLQGRRHQHRRHRQRRRDGQEHGPDAGAGELGRYRLGAAHGRQGRHLRLGRQPRCVQEGDRNQLDRQLRLHPHRGDRDEHDRADGVRRAWRDRQHRLGRRVRRPDRSGRVLGFEGWHRRHDPADRPRPVGHRRARQHGRAGPDRHARSTEPAMPARPSRRTSRRASCSRNDSARRTSWPR